MSTVSQSISWARHQKDDVSAKTLHKIISCFRKPERDNKKLFFNLKKYSGIFLLVLRLQRKANPSTTGTRNDHSYRNKRERTGIAMPISWRHHSKSQQPA